MMEQLKRMVLCCLFALTVLYINMAYADSRWNVEITSICVQEAWQQHPHIYEDRIIWKDFRSGYWDIYLFDLSEKVEVPFIIGDRNQDDQGFMEILLLTRTINLGLVVGTFTYMIW